MGFEDVQQLRDGLFRKCAGSAHDPGKLSMKEDQAESEQE